MRSFTEGLSEAEATFSASGKDEESDGWVGLEGLLN